MLVPIVLSSLVIFLFRTVDAAVSPAACHAPFRWDDCGKDPTPVMYYWKTGSRCEVGMWRGCLPNINMFPNEYECVATCIFSMRAGMQDYHAFNELEMDSDEGSTKDPYDVDYTESVNVTNATAGNDTETSETEGDDGANNDTTTTEAGVDVTSAQESENATEMTETTAPTTTETEEASSEGRRRSHVAVKL